MPDGQPAGNEKETAARQHKDSEIQLRVAAPLGTCTCAASSLVFFLLFLLCFFCYAVHLFFGFIVVSCA